MSNAGFEEPTTVPQNAPGWTHVDILGAGDFRTLGVQTGTLTVGTVVTLPPQGNSVLSVGTSSVYHQKIVESAVTGTVYNISMLVVRASNSYCNFKFYLTTSPQTELRSIAPLVVRDIPNLTSYVWTRYSLLYTTPLAVAGLPLYLNLESYRNTTNAISVVDDIRVCTTTP